ncbi:MAG: Crp/Fnr family transcriptional regulator [Beijerinckiaceae bacterium]|nr:Crp/Fnr family transcriptional regulator [Beijerinckiaceae bacterium]
MALDDDIRELARNPMLCDFEPEALRLIAFAAESLNYRAGDVLFLAGEAADGGYLLRSGSVSLEREGDDVVVMPPCLLGGTALITETLRPATAVVREPSSLLKIPRSLFLRVLNEYPDSAVLLHKSIAARLQSLARELDTARASVFDE